MALLCFLKSIVVSVEVMGKATNLRDDVAAAAVRAVNRLSRLTGRGSGTVVGGRVGMKIAPDLVASLSRGRSAVLVSGTNGKTTTTSMIVAGWGGSVTTNETGANMPAGHLAALVESSSEHVALEVDEAWLADTLASTRPRVVVLLNLSRDQLDRANEVRQMAERWRRALTSHVDDHLTVVANANDPLIVYASEVASNVVWCDVPTSWLADAVSCPHCTLAISHVGNSWHCTCGFAKPTKITTVLGDDLAIDGALVALDLSMPGEFNRSNAAMALTALDCVGVNVDEAVVRINAVQSVVGRFSVRHWKDHVLRLLLAKNPSGFAAMLATLPDDSSDVWVAINARIADGRDPSWLYDVPFEMLRGHRVYCFGDRRLDLATRLDYGQVDYIVVDNDALVPSSKVIVPLLANYTAFSDWLEKSEP
jgi:UDP-N-acetylmuramyl tripeptide synthase